MNLVMWIALMFFFFFFNILNLITMVKDLALIEPRIGKNAYRHLMLLLLCIIWAKSQDIRKHICSFFYFLFPVWLISVSLAHLISDCVLQKPQAVDMSAFLSRYWQEDIAFHFIKVSFLRSLLLSHLLPVIFNSN